MSANDEAFQPTGGGGGRPQQSVQDEVESVPFTLQTNAGQSSPPSGRPAPGAELVEPEFTTSIDFEVSGNMVSYTDQCGHTETDKIGNKGWTLTAEGVCSQQVMEQLKEARQTGDILDITSDVHSGLGIIQDLKVKQVNEQVAIEMEGGTEKQLAMGFQVQLKAPNSD